MDQYHFLLNHQIIFPLFVKMHTLLDKLLNKQIVDFILLFAFIIIMPMFTIIVIIVIIIVIIIIIIIIVIIVIMVAIQFTFLSIK